MNTLLTTFAFIAALFALALPASIVFLALKLKAGIVVNVAAQAPVALLPERVQATLDAIDAKLTPTKVRITDDELRNLVYEAVALAEQSKLKGVDRFHIAKDYVLHCAQTRHYEVDDRDVAKRIEAAVALSKRR